ncbi:polysaccharide biosynthesis protein, partial [Bacillus sp. LL01]|uniref:nucleoside-diphosphate sugar epimerase/dehydratase n=1 Tax=Bacillus sp. LL01 TaxID=1665556 RepID=UPI00064D21EF
MSYKKRIASLVLVDSLIVILSIFLSYFILLPTGSPFTTVIIVSSIVLFLSHHLFAHMYKLYKRVWQYASIGELTGIFKAVTFSVLLTAVAQFILIQDIYFRTLAVTWMMHILLIGGSRFSWRLYRDTYIKPKLGGKRTLIIGAGSAGTMVARQLRNSNESDLDPIGFIDDDKNKCHLEILDLPVLGNIKEIGKLVNEYSIEHIIIAIPSLGRQSMNEIFAQCTKTKVKTQVLPKMEDLITGDVEVNQFRDVEVEDLLGREPVELDIEGIADYISNKTILVTGAGGSIGSEFCRQIARF